MSDYESLIIPISALQQYSFCPRRCALMFLESSFVENAYTVGGSLAHNVVDVPGHESRGDFRTEDALPIFSDKLGIVGRADRVEFDSEIPHPIEFKRGAGQGWENNKIQLCAQAMCLEEMFGKSVPEGAIYHIASHRRESILFDKPLRDLTENTIRIVRELFKQESTPSAVLEPKCNGCSLKTVCMPEASDQGRKAQVDHYLRDIWRT